MSNASEEATKAKALESARATRRWERLQKRPRQPCHDKLWELP